MSSSLSKNLADLTDAFQQLNGMATEDLLPPAAIFALGLIDKDGKTFVNPNPDTIMTGIGGNGLRRMVRATFDPSGNANHRAIGAHGLGVYVPKSAIMTNIFYDVVTTFTSATDAATVALHAEAANGLLSAIAISDASNVLDAGIHAGKIGYPNFGADAAHDTQLEVAALFAAAMVKTTARREVTATVAVEALLLGKMNIWIEYVKSN